MLDQERSKYRGGILADDMGLGKTVQMIATMVMNPPDEESDVRTTLIVLPTALLQQWKDELENKTNGMFDVHIHHGTKKIKKLQDMKAKDVRDCSLLIPGLYHSEIHSR
jgi:SNF2 family DNA or RNA helicase